jgi:Fe-S-cluster-containing hydrogenase component 2
VSYRNDGVLREPDLTAQAPGPDRLRAGPVVVVECVERIPCNPCVAACPKGAITIEGDLNDVPRVEFALCDGCGLCVSACPGLAIFVVDQSGEGDTGVVKIPYEFVPLPEVGSPVRTFDREGEPVGRGTVVRVLNTKALDRTPIVSIEVPKADVMSVRHFRMEGAE